MRATRNSIQPLGTAKRQRGLTLVELMVAVTIGLIITAAVAQVYISSRTSYTLEEGMARVQENGRFAVEFLAYDLRMAGYSGCNSKLASTLTTNNVDDNGDNIADGAYTMTPGGISAHRYTGSGTAVTDWSPALPSGFFTGGEVAAGTDVIVVKYGSPEDTTVSDNMIAVNANIQILPADQAKLDIEAGDVLMVSDCRKADIFRATSVSNSGSKKTIAHSSGNASNNLSKLYGMDAQLMKLISRAYYIGPGTGGQPALFRAQIGRDAANPNREELVQGIEDMRFLYAEDTDGNRVPDVYRAANSVSDWNNVYGVRMGVLVRTPETTPGSDGNTYELAGTPVTKTDNYRRHAFNTLIQLRN